MQIQPTSPPPPVSSNEALARPLPTQPAWLDRRAYPFQSHHAQLPDGRMHYVDEGSGEAVLFVHGTPTWSFEYRHLIAGLSATHRCVAPDHLGFGLSERPSEAAYDPASHARRLRAFVDAIGLRRFTLVVHDFGGPIALPMALDDPERVSGLVVMNSWMWSFAQDREMARRARLVSGRLGRFLYRRLNASLRMIMPGAYADRSKLTAAIHDQYLSVFSQADGRERVLWALARALGGAAPFYDGLWQRRARLAGLPALIVWGMKDSAFRPRHLERWREALPQATLVQVEDAGHWPHEESPATVLHALRSFLAGAH